MDNLSDKPWLVPGHMYQYDIGWLVDKILSFETELNTAIDLKTIHYADPIQWDITTQYAPNTVVVDPKTGTAYMSKVPVPSGILLTNSDYWVVIFNYQRIYDKIMSGVAFNDKDNLNATKDLLVNDLVWYGGDLYRCTREITKGTTYIPGTNLTPTTIEDCLATYYGRDRVAEVLNDTISVSGYYTLNAGDIAETASNVTLHSTKDMLLDADGNLTEQVTGNKTSEVGGKLTEQVTGSREIDVDGDDSIHVDGVTSINRGGAVTEVYGSSVDKRVTGAFTESFGDTAKTIYNGRRIIGGHDFDISAESAVIHFPDRDVNLNALPSYVNVKDFGAVGNANYYDINKNAFFTDSTGTTRPTSDVDAVNAAINYALKHGIHTVYFPDGDYYLPAWSYTLDTSKLSFEGSGHACLCREGAEQNAMITLTSTVSLDDYTYSRTPLRNISLHGNSFTGRTDEGENGIAGIDFGVKGNSDATLISPHINLVNVTVQGFSCGLRIGTAYKSTLINFNAIACNYAIYIMGTGLAQAVPLNFYNLHIEVCNHAIWCLAPRYNEINVFGGALEYCRQFVATNSDISFFGTRFESDLLAFMDVTNGVNLPGFNITGASLHMHSCYILLIPNYVDNVKHWQPNTTKLTKYDTAFISVSSTAVPGLFAEDLEISTDQWDSTSTYFISGSKLAIFNSHLLGGIASKNNAVIPKGLLDPAKGFFGYTPT